MAKKKKKNKKQHKKSTAAPKVTPKKPKKGGKASAKKGSSKKSSKKKTVAKISKAPQAPAKAKQPGKISKAVYKARKPIIAVASVLTLGLFFQIASMILTYGMLDRAAPGTIIAGENMSNLTSEEIQLKLEEAGRPYLESKIIVKMDGAERQFSPEDLGIKIDAASTLQYVDFVKFDNSNLATIAYAAWKGKEIPFYNTVDVDKAATIIEDKFAFADKKTKNATLAFEGGALVVVPEVPGKAVDKDKLLNDLKVSASDLTTNSIEVEIYDFVPTVLTADLEANIEEFKPKLNNKITLNFENFNFNLKLIDNLDWVVFENLEGLEGRLKMNIANGFFNAYIDETISPLIEIQPEDVKIYYDENHEVVIEGKGLNGQTINREAFHEALVTALNNGPTEEPTVVAMPVDFREVNVDVDEELKAIGITQLIATGRSAFAGSTNNRIHNINTGIAKFNGHIIAPGETFSFNTILGPVEAYTGFKPELVIKPEGTIPEYGGGLCQVSSTMYRAALLAGLPIVERTNHSYAVSYYTQVYGYGLDATIYPGVHDVRYINDTPGHILIQGYTEGIKAFFNLYGTSDGRSVELEGPYLGGYTYPGPTVVIETPTLAPGQKKWMENSHTGFNATWYRYLTNAAGETVKEAIYSRYQAIPAKVLVGAGGGESAEGGAAESTTAETTAELAVD